jgi:hypothetical protein
MSSKPVRQQLWKPRIAFPQDHGSWVFLLSPLLIGVFAGGGWSPVTTYVVVGSLAAFLIRQPVTTLVKVYSGRRSQRDLPAAYVWSGLYALVGMLAVAGMLYRGFGYILVLAIPGVPVFLWHLYLVSRRSERRQAGMEILAAGVLALAAPAALWAGEGSIQPIGWLLWLLVWLQSAASIVYAYLRLEQRGLDEEPGLIEKLRMGTRALLYTTFNFALVIVLGAAGLVSGLLWIAYALQWGESIYGTLRPAIGWKPTAVGFRQLAVSSLFTILFILFW